MCKVLFGYFNRESLCDYCNRKVDALCFKRLSHNYYYNSMQFMLENRLISKYSEYFSLHVHNRKSYFLYITETKSNLFSIQIQPY